MPNFELEAIKAHADLLAICGRDTPLKRVATTNGGEYAGPCAFCGGRDRFRVQPNARPFPLWMCRHCTQGKWDTVIGYIARRDRLDPRDRADLGEICCRAGGGAPGTDRHNPTSRQPSYGGQHSSRAFGAPPGARFVRYASIHNPGCGEAAQPAEAWRDAAAPEAPAFAAQDPRPAYAPPDPAWQAAAEQIVAECEAALWQPHCQAVRAYLHRRGLNDDTLRHFHLGYCSTGQAGCYGREIAGLYVPRGLILPCRVRGQYWYLKVRLVPGVPCRCQGCKADLPGPGQCPHCGRDTRYLAVKGSKTNVIFNADALLGAVMGMFCEGEIDCMTAYQEFNGVMPAVTFGSASNHPDLGAWASYLLPLRSILISYDTDLPGQKGAEWLQKVTNTARLAPLPPGFKDINEYHQRGGDLFDWAVQYQAFYSQPIFR